MRAYHLAEALVGRVRKVGVTISFTFEGEEVAVGEAFVVSFGAIVGAPLEAVNGRYLARKGLESGFHLRDASGVAVLLEGEKDYVTEQRVGAGSHINRSCLYGGFRARVGGRVATGDKEKK